MSKRTIEISHRSHLSLKNKQLVISQNGNHVGSIPVEDIGEIILNDPSITMTQAVMVESQKNNVALILCDEKHLPISTMLPLVTGNKLHSKVLRTQIDARASTIKRLWQSTVRTKLENQAATLDMFGATSIGITRMITKVKSGDSTNIEAQAARTYWPLLFGESFRRRDESNELNSLLNYGYAVIRASVARSLVSSGLHPAIGIHHHNQYNGMALADDLLEPFRPWVDARVKSIQNAGRSCDIDKKNKQDLLGLLSASVIYGEERIPFLQALNRLTAELKTALAENRKSLNWPVRQ